MKIFKLENSGFYKRALQLISIGNNGVQMAIVENERLGLPNIFGIKNRIYYRMPDGSITTKSPFNKASSKKSKH